VAPEAEGHSFAFGSSRGGLPNGTFFHGKAIEKRWKHVQKRRNLFFGDSLESLKKFGIIKKVWKIVTIYLDFQPFLGFDGQTGTI
jgi:hypothetical protein